MQDNSLDQMMGVITLGGKIPEDYCFAVGMNIFVWNPDIGLRCLLIRNDSLHMAALNFLAEIGNSVNSEAEAYELIVRRRLRNWEAIGRPKDLPPFFDEES